MLIIWLWPGDRNINNRQETCSTTTPPPPQLQRWVSRSRTSSLSPLYRSKLNLHALFFLVKTGWQELMLQMNADDISPHQHALFKVLYDFTQYSEKNLTDILDKYKTFLDNSYHSNLTLIDMTAFTSSRSHSVDSPQRRSSVQPRTLPGSIPFLCSELTSFVLYWLVASLSAAISYHGLHHQPSRSSQPIIYSNFLNYRLSLG